MMDSVPFLAYSDILDFLNVGI